MGLTRGSGRSHLVRASLEAMAYSAHDLMAAMAADWGHPVQELRADGGAAANDWLMQFQADVTGIPVRRPAMIETTALGAAALAGLAAGFWSEPEELRRVQRLDRQFAPALSPEEREPLLRGWRRAIQAAAAWAAADGTE